MKKLLSIILIAYMAVSLTACANFIDFDDRIPGAVIWDKSETPVETLSKLVTEPETCKREIAVSTPEDFAGVLHNINRLAEGADTFTIRLNADFDMNPEKEFSISECYWTPAAINNCPADIVIDGQDHTLYHLETKREDRHSGLIGQVENSTLTIRNLKVKDAEIEVKGKSAAAVLVGHNNGNLSIEDVSLSDCSVEGYGSLAAIVGYAAESKSAACNIEDLWIVDCEVSQHTKEDTRNAGLFAGTIGEGNVTISYNPNRLHSYEIELESLLQENPRRRLYGAEPEKPENLTIKKLS